MNFVRIRKSNAHTDLFNDQGKPVYSLSYYQDGGKLYPWNERTTEYDENGKPTVSSKSFGIDGADGEKSAEELMDSVAYKDEWLFNKFAEHAGTQAEPGPQAVKDAAITAAAANSPALLKA